MKSDLPSTVLVIFGVTGDLSHRYLLPALSQICRAGRLPEDFKILGVSRQAGITREKIFGGELEPLRAFSDILQMDLADQKAYDGLEDKLKKVAAGMSAQPQIIFYLVVPPAGVLPIIEKLGQAGLNGPRAKLLLEKPFGVDLYSARELISATEKYFSENQVYRIDHYLAKEMAQNIAVFLGSNNILQGLWNKDYIKSIDVIAAEKIDIEGRAGFYESTGALRDVGQSHLLQLAALTLMEPCSDIFDFEEIPRRRLAALERLRPPAPDQLPAKVTRAQYKGYGQEVKNPGSQTETWFDICLDSTDPRWQGVPIRLVAGKAFDQKLTEIRVNFKEGKGSPNQLILRIQPQEGIELYLWIKQPGYERALQKLPLSFNYGQHFDRLPDAYEQVLLDAMNSNHSLFAGSREVLESWRILQPILEHWSVGGGQLIQYKKGESLEQALAGFV
ncbi:MAG TPA: glucose-6-phosphate dehydrogenase [Candidatus Saccharimonadales bacterium]|nr:glucose-6-phosphate dehydrogenase [Candidatus Saccharimonadales bacterium]